MNSKERFLETVRNLLPGCTEEEAEKVWTVYRKLNILELGHGGTGYKVSHGMYLDHDILQGAIDFDMRML